MKHPTLSQEYLHECLHRRYACRSFDSTKMIPQEDLKLLAESIRLAPSSMGLEPCRAIFVSEKSLKARLAEFSHTQKPVLECSTLLILMNQKPHTLNMERVKEHYMRHGKSQKDAQEKVDILNKILGMRFNHDSALIMGYMREQVYLAMGDMIRVASLRGIDSLIIGGFDADQTYRLLNEYPQTFTQDFMPCVLVALGYGLGAVTPKQRLPFNEVVAWM